MRLKSPFLPLLDFENLPPHSSSSAFYAKPLQPITILPTSRCHSPLKSRPFHFLICPPLPHPGPVRRRLQRHTVSGWGILGTRLLGPPGRCRPRGSLRGDKGTQSERLGPSGTTHASCASSPWGASSMLPLLPGLRSPELQRRASASRVQSDPPAA